MAPTLRLVLAALVIATLVVVAGYIARQSHYPGAGIGLVLWGVVVLLVANRRRRV